MGTGKSVYNLTLAGLAFVLSLVLVWESTPRSCGCSRAATGWCAPPLALLLAGAGFALRDPAGGRNRRVPSWRRFHLRLWQKTDT